MITKEYSEFFEVYDWLKRWGSKDNIAAELKSLADFMGAVVGMQAHFGIPTLYVSRAGNRIRGVMIGWPAKPMSEDDKFPPLDAKGKQFFMRYFKLLPKYKKSGLSGFGDTILGLWPEIDRIVLMRGEKLQTVWEKKKEAEMVEA